MLDKKKLTIYEIRDNLIETIKRIDYLLVSDAHNEELCLLKSKLKDDLITTNGLIAELSMKPKTILLDKIMKVLNVKRHTAIAIEKSSMVKLKMFFLKKHYAEGFIPKEYLTH